MIFGQHNFTANYLNAVGYNDEFMSDQIIIDEVARLIVDDKKNVVEALRKNGVNATYQDNNDLIKALMVKEIENENPDIIRFLTDRIIANQLNEEKYHEFVDQAQKNATGTTGTKSKFSENVGKVLQNENVKDAMSTLLSKGIKKVFSKKNKSKTSNDQQLSERLKVNEMQASTSTKKSSKKILIIVFASLAGATIIGTLIYFLMKRKYENGGMINDNMSDSMSDMTTTSMPPSTTIITQ
jgi:hypothetical protein